MDFDKNKALQMAEKTGHSFCSPSQLPRILLCPGSLAESTRAPIQESSSYAKEGTRKHELTADLLLGKPKSILAGETESDRQDILYCVDYAKELFDNHRMLSEPVQIWIEKMVDLSEWGMPDIYGTSDFGLTDRNVNVAHIVDWKFGSGVTVYAQENAQLMAYAAGAIGFDPVIKEIHIHVVQPAIGHTDVWVCSFDKLKEWIFLTLEPGLQTAMSADAPYNPGEKQCQFCPAAMTCRYRYQQSLETAKQVFATYQKLSTVSKQELADLIERMQDLQSYCSQIYKFAENELLLGREFPGYKLVSGRSIRKWDFSDDDIEAWLLGNSNIKAEKLKTSKIISPAQAEKLDRHLKKDPDFQRLITKPPGKPQLVKTDDPRPALQPANEASATFKAALGKEDE